jgi:hypothetical protein
MGGHCGESRDFMAGVAPGQKFMARVSRSLRRSCSDKGVNTVDNAIGAWAARVSLLLPWFDLGFRAAARLPFFCLFNTGKRKNTRVLRRLRRSTAMLAPKGCGKNRPALRGPRTLARRRSALCVSVAMQRDWNTIEPQRSEPTSTGSRLWLPSMFGECLQLFAQRSCAPTG